MHRSNEWLFHLVGLAADGYFTEVIARDSELSWICWHWQKTGLN
jgi:hypothetical protein